MNKIETLSKKEIDEAFEEILKLGEKPEVQTTSTGASYVDSLALIASLSDDELIVSQNEDTKRNEKERTLVATP